MLISGKSNVHNGDKSMKGILETVRGVMKASSFFSVKALSNALQKSQPANHYHFTEETTSHIKGFSITCDHFLEGTRTCFSKYKLLFNC